jgi:hypothetical protein
VFLISILDSIPIKSDVSFPAPEGDFMKTSFPLIIHPIAFDCIEDGF